MKFTKDLNNFRTVGLILTKFGRELPLDALQTVLGPNGYFSKSNMAADEKLKFTKKKLNNVESVGPICTKFGIYQSSSSLPERACGPKMLKFIIQDGRRPPY